MNKYSENKIMVAMSGGVDSSVTALLLQKQGYEVEGAMLRVNDSGMSEEDVVNGKLSESVKLARDVARKLKMNFQVIDTRKQFKETVIKDFVESYEHCLTPNPCIICNPTVKFRCMLDAAEQEGCAKVASGHYASIEYNEENGRYIIRKGKDIKKDQSYMLYRLSQEQLSKIIMPLGNFEKEEIRLMALEAGFKNAQAPDSQDICFLPDGNYAEFVKQEIMLKEKRNNHIAGLIPGSFVDASGNVYGQHKGLINYTIGQRKGLGLSLKQPMYVCEKRFDTNEVVLGLDADLYTKVVRARDINYVSVPELKDGQRVSAKVRYSQNETMGTVKVLDDGKIEVVFDEPVRAATPGQSMVLYDGDIVLAGGFIV